MVALPADRDRALLRYLDTGSRDPSQALGAWLAAMTDDESVTAVRLQSGFFGAEALGYFVEVFERLAAADGPVSLLVGSNDGTTKRRDVELLLELAGPPREGRRLGVVAFDNAYFHPKTFHFERFGGSAAAYVGSANLTRSGAASLHVEAGVVLDTNDGDDPAVLDAVRAAVDWWFESTPDGFTLVTDLADLDDLVARGRLDVPRPPLVRPVAPSSYVRLDGSRHADAADGDPEDPGQRHRSAVDYRAARRERRGERRAAGHDHDAAERPPGSSHGGVEQGPVAVRRSEEAAWQPAREYHPCRRRLPDQRADLLPLRLLQRSRVDGRHHKHRRGPRDRSGRVRYNGARPGPRCVAAPVSYAPNREASQANYTTLLHVGSLGPQFAAHDMTGRTLRLERRSDGSFALSIE